MSEIRTAKLFNAHGRVTLHTCVRLEMRRIPRHDGPGAGSLPGIYPIFQCSETGSERIFGCLSLALGASQLGRLYPGAVIECIDDFDDDLDTLDLDDDLDQGDDDSELAA